MIYKTGAKEIAAQEGMSITFMAKFDEREGNSCHIHLLAREATAAGNVFADDEATFDRFVAGQLAALRELTLFFAPHVNSYKRFVEGSFAPTAVAWGHDNRTCSMRVVGHGAGAARGEPAPGRRREPVPRARRDDRRRPARRSTTSWSSSPPSRATPTSPTSRGCRTTMYDARDLFAEFGDRARGVRPGGRRPLPEPRARSSSTRYEAAVTDWEKFRGFERL